MQVLLLPAQPAFERCTDPRFVKGTVSCDNHSLGEGQGWGGAAMPACSAARGGLEQLCSGTTAEVVGRAQCHL